MKTRNYLSWGLKQIPKTTIALFLALQGGIKAQAVLVPYTGSLSVPCGSNVPLQDHAGNANYNNSADGFVVFNAGAAAIINITGTYNTESSWDYVRIYNGVGTGGTLLQSYTGSGNINFQGAPGQTLTVRFQSDASVTYPGFDFNVTYTGACSTVACTGAPASNTVVGPQVLICPNTGPNSLTLTNTYISGNSPATAVAMTGLTYQWYSGTVSPVGPFPTMINSATLQSYAAPGVTTTTWYQAVITCTNGALTTSATAGAVMIAGTTTSAVPYYDSFEGIGFNNKLPNCSWYSASLGSVVQTYTAAQSNNRVPRTGSSFGAFAAPSNSATVWTNGIQMEPGVTYSAAVYYSTDYLGSNNWNNLRLMVGPNQNNTGIFTVASVSPAIAGNYALLSGLFTVPSSGLYYVAVSASGSSGNAPYLMIDDISVTIPCTAQSGNSPTVTATSNSTIYCQNDQVTANAFGADTYYWSTGEMGPVSTPTALTVGLNTLYVSGTNTLTGCAQSASLLLNVIPSPGLSLFANNPQVCVGQPVNISAFGTGQVVWSNNANGPFITVRPTSNTTYSATITGSNGCTTTQSIAIVTMPLPTITIVGGLPEICAGEPLTLTGSGASTYQWNWNVNVSSSNMLLDNPNQPTTYTLTGTNSNGCVNKATYSQLVSPCQSITEQKAGTSLKVYPNPSTGLFTLEGSVEHYSVTDVSGRLVLSGGASEGQVAVDLSALASGIYYLQVEQVSGNQNFRLVKN